MKELKLYSFDIEDTNTEEIFEKEVYATNLEDAYNYIMQWKQDVEEYTVVNCCVSPVVEGMATYKPVNLTKI